MARITLQMLGNQLRERRGDRGLREVANDIGISVATLSRIERGRLPDLETFGKVCQWLQIDPAEVLDIKKTGSVVQTHTVSAHFRADRNLTPAAAQALANMILRASAHLSRSDDNLQK